MSDPRPGDAAPGDPAQSAARTAWRLAVASLTFHARVIATASRGAIETMKGVELPEDDLDLPLVRAVEKFLEAMTSAHADLQEASRQQLERERAAPDAPAVH